MKASVIIPTLNRCFQLKKTIESLLEIDFNQDFEIIVVDNGSIDKTKEIVLDIKNNTPNIILEYYFEPISGLLSGRHMGAKAAKSEILIFIDDDVIVEKEWLSTIVNTFEHNSNIKLIGGKCLPLYENTPPQWLEHFWYIFSNGDKMLTDLSLCDYGNEPKQIKPTWIFGLNFSIRKSTFIELKGFHPDNINPELQFLQGDGETGLSQKMIKKGFIAYYHPKATVYHLISKDKLTVSYFEKRYFYQGVCDSYTLIRKALFFPFFYSSINILMRKIKTNIKIVLKKETNDLEEASNLKLRLSFMEEAGFKYHQAMAKKYPQLLKWIKKDDYFDYNLPVIF